MEATLISYEGKLTRPELALVPTPAGTATHRPIPHVEVVEALVETLGFRHIAVHKDEYAVSKDGMKMFGLMELETVQNGVRFAIGIRNAHDKSMRLAMTVGYRVLVCENMAFHGDFEPVLAKHTKNFNLKAALSVGVDDMQRNFTPMVQAIESWQGSLLNADRARLIIYEAFVEGQLEAPKHLARMVHDQYFNSADPTFWGISNAFTAAFKELEPVPQFKATNSLAGFLEQVQRN